MNRRKPQARKDSNPDMATTMGSRTQLLGQVMNSAEVFSGVNKQVTATIGNSYIGGVKHISISPSSLINFAATLTDPVIQEVIDGFSSSRGYVSSVTPSIVRDYIVNSVEALSAIYVLKKLQDIKQLKDGQGRAITNLFAGAPSGGYNDISLAAYDPNVTVSLLGQTNISNAVWANTYLSELSKIRVPHAFGQMIKTLFEGVYKFKSSPVETYVQFWPGNIVAGAVLTTPEASFAAKIAAIDSAVSTDSDLLAILQLLDITPDFAMNENFERDLKGQTLVVYSDPLLETMIVNNWVTAAGLVEADIPQEIVDTVFLPFNEGSMFNYVDNFTLGLDMVPYTILFRRTANDFAAMQLSLLRDDGGLEHRNIFPTGEVTGLSALDGTGDTRTRHLLFFSALGERVFPVALPYSPIYIPTTTSASDFGVTVSTGFAYYGYNAMHLQEVEANGLVDIYVTNLLFGPDFRANIKSKVAELYGFIRRG